MKILLIGNFAPPYEEESLYNLSLLRKLEEDNYNCTVINVSCNTSTDNRFIDTGGYIDYVFKLFRHCRGKTVVHFSTKGYLRLGLLKLMTSVLIGRLYRVKPFITIHSELFAIEGQLRSPVGGRQTLFTSFAYARNIMCSDKDTYNVATTYQKKTDLELVPSFVYMPRDIAVDDNSQLNKLKTRQKFIVFQNVRYPSFLFEILDELISRYPVPSEVGIIVSIADKHSSRLKTVINEKAHNLNNNLALIDPGDLNSTLMAYSRADMILKPLSCDGLTLFDGFALTMRKTFHIKNYVYTPSGLVLIKEGEIAELCACIINTLLCQESKSTAEIEEKDSYNRIKEIYES